MIIQVRDKKGREASLELRTLVPGNADEVFDVIDKDREYLRKWLPWVDDTYSPYHSLGTIERWKKAFDAKSGFVFGIFLGGNYIGNIGIHDIDKNNNSAMIGYWLGKNHQGKGIMTDCVRVLTNFGFDELELNRIWIGCAFGNVKSRAIPERLGYVQEGILQDGICLYGVYHDGVIYGVVKRNWKGIK